MEKAKHFEALLASSLTRRVVLKTAGGALVTSALFPLTGCGGSRGSGTGSKSVITNAQVSFGLPSGVKGANLSLLTGYGSTKGLGASGSAIVQSQNVTAAMIVDTASGKPVLIGLIDSTKPTNVLDATNLAATLIFYKIGGAQIVRSNRSALWKLVLADPATATFATVVKARLSADAFALADHDPQILSGLKSAVSSLSSATLAGINPPPVTPTKSSPHPIRGVLPTPPSPDVLYGSLPLGGDLSPVDSNFFYIYDSTAPDFIAAKNTTPIELCCFVFDRSATKSDQSVVQAKPGTLLFGPIPLDPSPDVTVTISGPPLSIGLVSSTDLARNVVGVTLTPVFDAPPLKDVDGLLSGEFTQFTTILQAMWQRAAVEFSNTILLEALGRPAVYGTIGELNTEIQSLSNISSDVSTAIANAKNGTDLQGTVNGILQSLFATSSSATAALTALNAIAPITVTPISLLLAQNYYGLHTWISLFDDASSNRSILLDKLDYSSLNGGPLSMDGVELNVYPIDFQIKATPETITPSTSMKLEITTVTGLAVPPRRYHWSLGTPFQGTISDGKGNSGTSFVSDSDMVTFLPNPKITGNQQVTCVIDNLESTPVYAGTASTTLLNGGFSVSISPASPTIGYGTTQAFTAAFVQPSGSTVTPTYQWSFLVYGSLTDPTTAQTVGPNATLTTSSKTVSYTAPKTDPSGGEQQTSNTIYLTVVDSNNKVLCKTTDNVSVAAVSNISPSNPTLASDSSQVFQVSSPAGSYPNGSTFVWTLTGSGSIGSSNTVTTTVPQITYDAPYNAATDTLSVVIMDSSGVKIGAASTTIASAPNYSISMVDSLGSYGTVSGPQVMYDIQTSKKAVPSFGADDIMEVDWGTNVITGVAMLIHRQPGTQFQAGQVYALGADGPAGYGYGYTPAAGQFFFFSISFFSGSLKITKVTPNPDKTTTVAFTIAMRGLTSVNYDFTGTGTMLVAPDGTDSLPPYP